MDPWIRKIGYPVLTVAEEPGQIGLRQSRFLSTGDVKATEDDTLWWVPLGLKTDPKDTGAFPKALIEKQETLRNVDEKFYKLNTEQTGFYRTNYPPARLAKLGESKDKLTDEDKIGLIADAAALAVSGEGTTAALLSFVENFKDETSYAYFCPLLSFLILHIQFSRRTVANTDPSQRLVPTHLLPFKRTLHFCFQRNHLQRP